MRNLIEVLVRDVNPRLNQEQQIMVVIGSTLLIVVIWVYVIPLLLKQKKRSLRHMDKQLLQMVSDYINEMHQELVATDVIRCWSCFKELDQKDHCSHCGKEQLVNK